MADIAPLLKVEDLSLYYFMILDIVVIFGALGILYFFLARFSFKEKSTRKAKKELLSLEFTHPKRDAYKATKLIKQLSNKNDLQSKKLLDSLKAHKYKKSVPEISQNLKRDIKEFAKEVDV